jgi:hypothetical protein
MAKIKASTMSIKTEEREHLGGTEISGRIILKLILGK